MKNRRNYYRILHVQPDAPEEVIRSSYRTIMQKMRMHPDLGGDEACAALINEAYTTLLNPQQRSAYDKSRQAPDFSRRAPANDASVFCLPGPAANTCDFCAAGYEEAETPTAQNFCNNCQSPLHLPRQASHDDADRRSVTRIPKDHPLEFCTHWPQQVAHSARTADISLHGMKFHSGTRLEINQVIKIDSEMLQAVARVTRNSPYRAGWEAGVEFIGLHFRRQRGSFIRERV